MLSVRSTLAVSLPSRSQSAASPSCSVSRAALSTQPKTKVTSPAFRSSSLMGQRVALTPVAVAKNGGFSPSDAGFKGSRRRLVVRAAKRVTSDRSLLLSCTLVAEESQAEKVFQLCEKITEWGQKRIGEKVGVLQFDCRRDSFEPNVFHFWERYQNFAALSSSRSTPEHTAFLDEVRPCLIAPVAMAAYEYTNGQIGCMLNPIGPKGEGGLDDATGQGGSGGGASYKQTSQSVQQGISEREGWGMEKAIEMSKAKTALAAKEAVNVISKGLKSLFGAKSDS